MTHDAGRERQYAGAADREGREVLKYGYQPKAQPVDYTKLKPPRKGSAIQPPRLSTGEPKK